MKHIFQSLFVLFWSMILSITVLFLGYFICFLILDFINYENIEWRYLLFVDVPVRKLIIGGVIMGIARWWVRTFGSESKKKK